MPNDPPTKLTLNCTPEQWRAVFHYEVIHEITWTAVRALCAQVDTLSPEAVREKMIAIGAVWKALDAIYHPPKTP